MADLSIFTPGASKYQHGISYYFNQTPQGKINREAQVKRNKDNQRALGAWARDAKRPGVLSDIPQPKRRTT